MYSGDNGHANLFRGLRWLYIAALAALIFSGFGQMPVFKRYYVAEIPGMAWAANFEVTLILHYLAAAVFLGLSGFYLVHYLADRRAWIQRSAVVFRGAVFGVLIGTGIIKVLKNLDGVYFDPGVVFAADWIHTIFTVVFMVGALAFFIKRRLRTQPAVQGG